MPARLAACLLVLPALLAAPAGLAQVPLLPGQAGAPAVTCGPANNSPACQALRQAVPGGAIPGVITPRLPGPPPLIAPPQLRIGDRAPQRLPPRILALLRDPRVDPLTRAYLLDLAGRKLDQWSVQDVQTLSAFIPTLAELGLPSGLIGELHETLGLEPGSLFEPQLGEDWQMALAAPGARKSMGRDARCLKLSAEARYDPALVRMQDLLTCSDD